MSAPPLPMKNEPKRISVTSNYQNFTGCPDVAVVIDVFRASNTVLSILSRGARYIIPELADTEEDAIALKAKYPDHVLFGEHNGIKFQAADYDNSPSAANKVELDGRKVVLATTMGTKAIRRASSAGEIIIASFGNLSTVAHYLTSKNNICLIASGEPNGQSALEDLLCAQAIHQLLQDEKPDLLSYISRLRIESLSARRLSAAGLKEDLELCLKLDYTNLIPKVEYDFGITKIHCAPK